jgi:DNA-binding CsgD family transcriptional regulator
VKKDATLTKRQQEVVTLLEKGKTPSQVATKLGISTNAIYMTVRRVEAKGRTVKVTESPRGRGRKPGPKPAKPQDNGNPPMPVSGKELIEEIKAGLKGDIVRITETMESNDVARTSAEQMVERLVKENAELSTQREKLEAVGA